MPVEVKYQLVSPAEYKKLKNELRLETSLFGQALRMAEKKWKEDKDNKNKSFPKPAVARRSVRSIATFKDIEKGHTKLAKLALQRMLEVS